MKATTKKKASGRNVAESERNTERITLRLDPEAMDLLRHWKAAWRCSAGDVVEVALDALRDARPHLDAMSFLASTRKKVRNAS